MSGKEPEKKSLASNIKLVFAVAIAYSLAARLSLLLAIPPGFSSPVWPAAGIAVCAALFWGNRVLPGIWLGSCIATYLANNSMDQVSLLSFIGVAFIGAGASLQAAVAAFLVRNFSDIGNLRSIFRFLFLVGPVACLVSATIGTFSLWLSNFIPTSEMSAQWITWWTGDVLGVLALAPIAPTWQKGSGHFRLGRMIAILTPFFIVLAVIISVFAQVSNNERHRVQQQFERLATSQVEAIKQNFTNMVQALITLEVIYTAFGEVDRKTFNLVTRPWIAENKVLQALEWIPKVPFSQRKERETLAGTDGFSNFHFTQDSDTGLIPAAERGVYFPVFYVEPYQGNEAALGLDLATNEASFASLVRAQDTGSLSATEAIRLVQCKNHDCGFLMFLPFYEPGKAKNSVDERRASLQGFMLGVFTIHDLVDVALGDSDSKGMGLTIFDGDENGKMIYPLTEDGDVLTAEAEIAGQMQRSAFSWTSTIPVYGQKWALRFSLDRASLAVNQAWGSWLVPAAGFLLISLVGAFLLWTTGHTAKVEHLVAQRTAELNQAKRVLGDELLERDRVEKALILARDAAEEGGRAKGQILANMSHEVRIPLNGVIGMMELLMETDLTNEQKEFAVVAQTSADFLLNVINDILDYSKIDAGKLQLESLFFKLGPSLDEIMEILKKSAKHKGLVLSLQLGDVPDRLCGDPGRLRQILLNLVDNAIKFTNEGRIEIRARLEKKEASKLWVRFEVQDTGIGIPESRLGNLFQSFSQIDSTGTRKYGGTGLGLTISKQLAEMMGGRIGVESKEGEGTTFWFTVILTERKRRAETLEKAEYPSQEPASLDGRGIRVLLVEDNIANQKVTTLMLKLWGYPTVVASNGLEALEALKDRDYQLVLMDCQMPKMDGFETASAIRKMGGSRSQVPIIAVTAYAMTGDRERCLAAGMDDYLSKPVRKSDLEEVLRRWHPKLVRSGTSA